MQDFLMKAAARALQPILDLEKFIFRLTRYELPLLRRFWDHRGRQLQHSLNREHGTWIRYAARRG